MTRNEKKTAIENMAERFMSISDLEGKSMAIAWLARVISFEAFSMMVDEALERMKKMLESNKAMQTLVSGEAGEVNE